MHPFTLETMTLPCNRLILQSDWDEAVRERNGKAWMFFKTGAPPSEYTDLYGHGLSPEGLPYLSTKDPEFTVSDITKKSVVVSYNGENSTLSRKFVAPDVTFTTIHSPHKQVTGLDTSPGGLGVSCDSEGKLKLWQTDTGEVRRELQGHVGDVYSCRLFPSGIVVLSAGSDMMAKIWSAETGQCAATLTGHHGAILDTAIVDRGRNVITTSRDGTVKLWDVGTQNCLASLDDFGGDVNCCSIGQPENSIDLGQSTEPISDREVATDGKMLMVGCENKSIQGYGLQSREQVFHMNCDSAVNACTFVSEVYAVCGTQEGHVYVLDLRRTNVLLRSWRESRGPILSLLPHKGGFFVTTGDGSCFHVNNTWDTTTELTGSDCDAVYRVSCDNTNIYTSCRDGTVRRYSLTYL